MIFSVLLAVLAFAAVMPILLPLLRNNRPVPERANYDQAVYRDQLGELDRDIARGLLSATEADTARLEIQRRLLAADRLPGVRARLGRSPLLAVVMLVFVTVSSLALYLSIGQPGMPDLPFSARSAEFAGQDQQLPLRQATEALAAKLKQNPSDADGWVLYGRSLALLARWTQAQDAYDKAVALGRNGADVLAARAEMQVLQANGTVTPDATATFKQILVQDAGNPVARYYLAVADAQAGQPKQAIDGLQKLLAELPADSPMRRRIGETIAQAAQQAGMASPPLAPGPAPVGPKSDGGAVANGAGMPDEQRMTMIRGMVASLAAKQQANPANLDGWLRLGQAYAVLHETDKAADAFDRAASLKPGQTSILLQEARALLSGQQATAPLAPRTLAVLKRIQAADPDQPVVLWYFGMNAAQNAQPQEARRFWTALLARIPSGSDDAKLVQQALDALPKPQPAPGG